MNDLTRTLATFGASLVVAAVGIGCPGPIAPPLEDAGADAATLSPDAGPDAGVDSGTDAGPLPPDAGPAAWLTDNLLYVTDGGVRVEQVTYMSGSLAINGEVCLPNDAFPHPLVMYNHGGFQGLGGYGDPFCVGLAGAGYVVGASSYRGEDGSGGQVEVCLGEVTDVRNMMSVLKAQPYVTPSRVAALGASHGGCITTALAIQEPTLKAAIDFFGPSDLPALYTFWENELANGEP